MPTGTPTPIHSAKPSSQDDLAAAAPMHLASIATMAAAFWGEAMGVGMPPMLQPKATASVSAWGRLVALSLSRMRGRSTCRSESERRGSGIRVEE